MFSGGRLAVAGLFILVGHVYRGGEIQKEIAGTDFQISHIQIAGGIQDPEEQGDFLGVIWNLCGKFDNFPVRLPRRKGCTDI